MTTVGKEGYRNNSDVYIDVEGNNSINNESTSLCAGPKPKNWPRCMPFIRHSIKEDIPPEFRTIMKLMLFHCFYVLVFLFTSLITTLIEMLTGGSVRDVIIAFISSIGTPVWIVVWGVLAFTLYAFLYKSIAHNKRGYLIAFSIGTVIEILMSIYVSVGFPLYAPLGIWSVFMGVSTGTAVVAFIVNIAFVINTAFLIVAFVIILARYPKLAQRYQTVTVCDESVAPKIGTTEALPAEVSGRKIKYFANALANARNLNSLPEDTITVISEWKKVGTSAEGSYLLYVENEPERVYRSSPQVDGILDNGTVNPVTQVLTISRLPGGSFVFGAMDKK